jgi:putative NADPH-quinone reductase
MRIAIIQGHPDPSPERFCRALAAAYRKGAEAAGHEVREIDVAALDFALLRQRGEWEGTPPPASIRGAQETVQWAEHVVIVFPLWLGALPALLKAFLEQLFRPGFAFRYGARGMPVKLLKGRSARIVVTMGMPAFFYELVYRAHSVKSLERNILRFTGFGPIKRTVVGMVEGGKPGRNAAWLGKMEKLGREAG